MDSLLFLFESVKTFMKASLSTWIYTVTRNTLTDEELGFVVGAGYCYYKVKSGDTLASIAQQLGVSQNTLISLNNIRYPDLLCPGQTLKYPA